MPIVSKALVLISTETPDYETAPDHDTRVLCDHRCGSWSLTLARIT